MDDSQRARNSIRAIAEDIRELALNLLWLAEAPHGVPVADWDEALKELGRGRDDVFQAVVHGATLNDWPETLGHARKARKRTLIAVETIAAAPRRPVAA